MTSSNKPNSDAGVSWDMLDCKQRAAVIEGTRMWFSRSGGRARLQPCRHMSIHEFLVNLKYRSNVAYICLRRMRTLMCSLV